MIKDWNEYFMEIAKSVSLRSNCLRANVGAVIVGQDKKIKATGYNGVPSNVTSCHDLGFCYRIANNIQSGTRYETCRSIHAEQNAIIQAGQDRATNGIMYIWGHEFICILCKRFIVQAGIKTVYLQKNETSPMKCIPVETIIQELSEPTKIEV